MRALHAQQVLQEVFKVLHLLGVQNSFVEGVPIEAIETQIYRRLEI